MLNTKQLEEQGASAADCRLLLSLLFALSLQSGFSNTKICQQIAGSIERGAGQDFLRAAFARVSNSDWDRATEEIAAAEAAGLSFVHVFGSDFPEKLRHVCDPPLLLFIRGRLVCGFTVAIVGTRRCTDYGRRVAYTLALEVARRGAIVVSGLAYGIDAAAHQGALAACSGQHEPSRAVSPGIAVLGSGLNVVSPAANRALAGELCAAGGAVVSEYGLSLPGKPYFFPRRNRIVSGLADLVIVVEAAERSGALITARTALEQGRDVYAVPGRIDLPQTGGIYRLIKDGAGMITNVADFVEALPLPQLPLFAEDRQGASSAAHRGKLKHAVACGMLEPAECELTERLTQLLSEETACNIDTLIPRFSLETAALARLLSRLELAGIIERDSNQHYRLCGLIDT